ncbi:MAG: site-specific DNA-methyltransferase [bacterium]
MEKDFYSQLENLLKKDSRFVDQEGDLLKSNVIDAAYKGDNKLVELLLSDKIFKTKFFSKVKDVLVFNINDFAGYIQDKNFLADSYTKFKNKIGLNIGGKFFNERKEVALVWPFKDCVLDGGMAKEDEKRHEIFFNEILAQDEIDKLLAPKVLTGWKRYAASGESPSLSQREAGMDFLRRDENGVIRENLIIKGNNLLALHCLKQQFQNKIKLIYIDPPYNTGNDSFGYNDSFNHSTWLTFMKNRLEAARELLREDGVIFISCDDNEQAYLKVLCDEIFGRENFIANIIWHSKYTTSNDAKYVSTQHENIIFFSKDKVNFNIGLLSRTEEMDNAYKNPDNDPRGNWKATPLHAKSGTEKGKYKFIFQNGIKWEAPQGRYPRFSTETLKRMNKEDRIYFGKDGKATPNAKTFLSEVKQGKTVGSVWTFDEVGSTHKANEELSGLLGKGKFNNPKSVNLIKEILKVGNTKNQIILDFFAGSGTTAQAVLELNKEDGGNRKFILVEQMDYVEKITIERVKKVIEKEKIKDDFVFCELMQYNEKFIEKIQKAKNTNELLKIWDEMQEKSFLNYNVDIKKFDEAIDDFKKLPLEKQKRALFDLLNKNQLYVNLSDIEDGEFGVGDGDKLMNGGFYGREFGGASVVI